MVITHNMLSMYTDRQLKINDKKLKTNMEKLSSGYKINRAADDAAGLAISEKMRRQIRGLNQGTENLQDGVSWVQIGDGAMEEINDILHRMTELAVKGANGTLSRSDREAIDAEMQQLKTEINRINETTKFNDLRIFSTQYGPAAEPPEFTINDLTGAPDDLKIFNASYDDVAGKVTYGGILFHGNRVEWDKIAPDMVYMDGDTQRFHEGTWSYTDARGRKLTFSAREGDQVPAITRKFDIKAGVEGLKIDGELIRWEDVKNEAGQSISGSGYVNGTWNVNYHGMSMSFEIDKAHEGFAGMLKAINGRHDGAFVYQAFARYAGEAPLRAVDINMNIRGIQVSEDVARKITAGEKYFLGADEDGLWLDVLDPATNTKNRLTGSEKTWADMGITSWNSGSDIRADYDYLYSDNDGTNDTHIAFSYTLADITSKDSVIDGLNGVEISFYNVKTSYSTKLDAIPAGGNVVSGSLTESTRVSIGNEVDLARDFDDPQHVVGTSVLQYDAAAGKVTLSYSNAGADVITYEGSDAAVRKSMEASLKVYEEQVIASKLDQALRGLPANFDLGPKDLKDYLGPGKITTSGKMTETVTIDSSMVRSDGSATHTYASPPQDGETYGCGRVDFSDIDTLQEIWELAGCGLDSTCNTCSKHYSFKFVMDTQGGSQIDGLRYRMAQPDSTNPVLEISVASLIDKGIANSADPGKELAEAIVKIASQGFDEHYQQYAAKDGVLYVLDNRPQYTGSNVTAQFYTTPYKKDYQHDYTIQLRSTSNGSQSFRYKYDHRGYDDRINVEMERDDAGGKYVRNATGAYEIYDPALHPTATEKYKPKISYRDGNGNVDASKTGSRTLTIGGVSVTFSTVGDIDQKGYIDGAVREMADVSRVTLAAKDYTRTDLLGNENPNLAVGSSFGAYYDTYGYSGPGPRKPESIRIQKSGDVENYLSIPKFALNTAALGLGNAACLTMDSSRNAIDMVSGALKSLSARRSIFGALQNRMEHAVNSNENTSENTTAAVSRIRDTDMAEEMASYLNSQIVSQAAQSLLAQANQSRQGVLGLLG